MCIFIYYIYFDIKLKRILNKLFFILEDLSTHFKYIDWSNYAIGIHKIGLDSLFSKAIKKFGFRYIFNILINYFERFRANILKREKQFSLSNRIDEYDGMNIDQFNRFQHERCEEILILPIQNALKTGRSFP